MSEYMERLKKVTDNHHQYAKEWKAGTGGKVMGYFCSYVPEELIYAAGILPVRIMGSHEPENVTGPHIPDWFCPFSRDSLAQGLKGRYKYLDGLVIGHPCVAMCQAFDTWQRCEPLSYARFLFVPSLHASPGALTRLSEELEDFKLSLEEWLGKDITEEDIERSVAVYNKNRSLLRRICELKKKTPPALSGSDAMEINLAGVLMDKEEHSKLLESILDELLDGKAEIEQRVRLMLIGSENDDRGVVRLIESLGANVVIDDYCNGSRYFRTEIGMEGDQIHNIARGYLNKPPCPQRDIEDLQRPGYLLQLAKDYDIQGAIFTPQKFCSPFELEFPSVQALFKENDIPMLLLELDIINPPEQFRTRIEAFLEMFQSDLM